MSERQRLINKYTTGLHDATLASYLIHFYSSDSDESAHFMILGTLKDLAEKTKNPNLSTIISSLKNGYKCPHFGVQKKQLSETDFKLSKEDKTHIDYVQRANEAFQKLELESALRNLATYKEFKLSSLTTTPINIAIKPICYLYLQCYPEAYHYSLKSSSLFDLSFCSLLALGNFEEAEKYTHRMLNFFKGKPSQFISLYELTHVLIYLQLALNTANDVKRIYEQLNNLLISFDFPFLDQIVFAFCNRDYKQFLSLLNTVQKHLSFSIYTDHVKNNFIQAIKANIVANFVEPFAKISFKTIMAGTDFSRTEIVQYLIPLIRSGRVNGKLDLVADEFLGEKKVSEFRKTVELLERNITIKQNILLAQFQGNYKSAITAELYAQAAKK